MMSLVLIIEPDRDLAEYLKGFLLKSGYEARTASSEKNTLFMIDKFHPDLIILDKTTTNLHDESFFQEIKQEYPNLPIILLIESFEVKKVTKLYRSGVDDFISKPIKTSHLLSRIKMQLSQRRSTENIYKIDNLILDAKTFKVIRNKKTIKLTPQEFKLLKFMMKNKDRVLSREMILSRVWGYNSEVQSRAVDVYVGYLRKKIDNAFGNKLIHTIRGFGYMIKE